MKECFDCGDSFPNNMVKPLVAGSEIEVCDTCKEDRENEEDKK
jgi:ribosome-binding protein aMBF1 (putative translation factor)